MSPHLRFTIAPALTLFAIGLSAPLALQAEPLEEPAAFAAENWDDEVPVVVRQGNNVERWTLISILDNNLSMRPRGRDEGVRLELSLENIDSYTIRPDFQTDAGRTFVSAFRNGDYPLAVETLRPFIFPLFRFLQVPPEGFEVIHELCANYLFALKEAGYNEEAYHILRRLPLQDLGVSYVQTALDVSNQLMANGLRDEALELVNIVPINEGSPEQLPLFMDFAEQLRSNGAYAQALSIYERVRRIPGSSDFKVLAMLWSAYCNIEQDNILLADILLEDLPTIGEREREFSLRKMIEGRLALANEDFETAMEHIAQGVVFSRLGDDWVPELLYLSGFCYENLGQPETARSIYEQMALFYPEDPWTEKGQERLKNLVSASSDSDNPPA